VFNTPITHNRMIESKNGSFKIINLVFLYNAR